MLRLRQILRYFTQGTSNKQISEITGVARNTVKRYIGRFITLKITYEDIVALTDHELECLFIEPHPSLPDAVQPTQPLYSKASEYPDTGENKT